MHTHTHTTNVHVTNNKERTTTKKVDSTHDCCSVIHDDHLARHVEAQHDLIADAVVRHGVDVQPVALARGARRRVRGRHLPRILRAQQRLVATRRLAW